MSWTRIEHALSFVTRLRPGEGRAALLFFLHAFLLMASFQMVKALREAFMLVKFSAESRAYAVALMALLLMFVVPLYGWMRRHLDGAQLLRAVTIFFVATLPVFAILDRYGISIAFSFYVWVGIYAVAVVSQMWAFAADSFNVRSGQRIFVLIMLGANLGALAGARFMHAAVAMLSPMGMMAVATCTLGATLFLAAPERDAIPEESRNLPVEREELPRPRLFGGIGLVLSDRYLLMIALFVVLLNWINTTGEFILANYVREHALASGEDPGLYIAAFYGKFHFWVTLTSLAIQLLLVSRIFRAFGMRGALLVHPIIVAAGYGLLALAPLLGGFIPIFSLIRRIKVADNGVDYSLMNTTRQALFLPVERQWKYDGKVAIDTFFWRFGDLIQAVVVYVGLHQLGWATHQFALLTFLLSLAWIALAVALGRMHSRKALASASNAAPEAVEPITDLRCAPGRPFRHRISPAAFRDPDPGDVLTLRACCDNGRPLPRWIRFDVRQQTFTGTLPANAELTVLQVTVIASDMDGLTAHSSFTVWCARG